MRSLCRDGRTMRLAVALGLLLNGVALVATLSGCGDTCLPPRVRYAGVCYSVCDSAWCDPSGDVADVPLPLPGDATADRGSVGDAAGDASGDAAGDASDIAPGCAPPMVRCATACVDTSRDPANCGACGMACTTTAPGAVATCAMSTCGFECRPGFGPFMTGCDPVPPRPIAPLSTANVTSTRPTLRWELPAGLTEARVEVCRTRACAAADIVATIDATGSSVRVPTALARGVAYWRVRGKGAGTVGQRTSPVWEFFVPARDSGTDTSWGSVLDVNGDGFADLAVGAPGAAMTGRVYVYQGGPRGISTTPNITLTGPDGADGYFGGVIAAPGDLDGDGFGELLVSAAGAAVSGRAYVFRGSDSGLAATPARSLTGVGGTREAFGIDVSGLGDVDGDGFGDVAVASGAPTASIFPPGEPPIIFPATPTRVFVFRGAAGGIAGTTAVVVEDPVGVHTAAFTGAFGDLDGDGLGEFGVGRASGGPMRTGVLQLVRVASGTPRAAAEYRAEVGEAELSAVWTLIGGADDERDPLLAVTLRIGAERSMRFLRLRSSSSTPFSVVATSSVRAARCIVRGGDLNGDGYRDAIFTLVTSGGSGALAWFPGGSRGLDASSPLPIAGVPIGSSFGAAVGVLGDVNLDGFDDVVVGAPETASWSGAAHVYFGSARGVAMVPMVLPAIDGVGGSFGAAFNR